VTPQPLPDPLWAGLGFSLEELEAQAEGGLASAVAELNDADRAPQVPGGGEPASAPDVAAAWRQALHHAAQRLKISEPWPATIVTAPTWLRSLLPPLAVMVPGPGFGGPALILLGTRPREGLEEAVEDLLLRDYLAVAAARANFRSARALLPAPELAEGWRATSAPRAGATELAWRSALALAAIAMARGRTGIDEAAAMIAAESGIDPEQARLQAMQVAERPLAALTFLAGRRVLIDGAARHGDAAVAAWLAEGALPGAALRALAG
jgi:hypothetical protein